MSKIGGLSPKKRGWRLFRKRLGKMTIDELRKKHDRSNPFVQSLIERELNKRGEA